MLIYSTQLFRLYQKGKLVKRPKGNVEPGKEEPARSEPIPFMGEPMPNKEVTTKDYYGL
jgi:hypothetical protein